MSLLDRLEVPDARSRASTRPTRRPREAASRAAPAPVMPPPMISTSSGPAASFRIASSRSRASRTPGITTAPPRPRQGPPLLIVCTRFARPAAPSALPGLQLDEVDALAPAFLAQQDGGGENAHTDQRGADREAGVEPGRERDRGAVPGDGRASGGTRDHGGYHRQAERPAELAADVE